MEGVRFLLPEPDIVYIYLDYFKENDQFVINRRSDCLKLEKMQILRTQKHICCIIPI